MRCSPTAESLPIPTSFSSPKGVRAAKSMMSNSVLVPLANYRSAMGEGSVRGILSTVVDVPVPTLFISPQREKERVMAVYVILSPGFMGQIAGLLHSDHKIDLIESGIGTIGFLSKKAHDTKVKIRGYIADDFDEVDTSLSCRVIDDEFRMYFDVAPERDWRAQTYDGYHPLSVAAARDFRGW